MISKHFTSINQGKGFNLSSVYSVKEDQSVNIELHKTPPNYDDVEISLDRLQNDLMLVKPPQVREGPISFQVNYAIWGGYDDGTKVTKE